MEGVLAGVLHLTTARKEEKEDGKQKILAEIEALLLSIESATSRFEYQSDPDLVEACIYELQSLAARYRYLTREARRLGVTKNTLGCLKHMD